jgi:hypothetical protein
MMPKGRRRSQIDRKQGPEILDVLEGLLEPHIKME